VCQSISQVDQAISLCVCISLINLLFHDGSHEPLLSASCDNKD